MKYQWHRLRRLPDPPHRVARGIFAGTFVNFPPIFGFQIFAAVALAWALRGNLLAAVLATLFSNPITTPIIAVVSLESGYWILGRSEPLSVNGTFIAFGSAASDIWHNLLAIFTKDVTHWEGLAGFWDRIYFPYLVGSIVPGILFSLAMAWATIPAVRAYQAMRKRRAQRKAARKRDEEVSAKAPNTGPDPN
jgi:uncharacterized protein (DUF2062 family)